MSISPRFVAPERTAQSVLGVLCAAASLAGCVDEPGIDHFRRDIPPGVSIGELVFSKMIWFECSVGVFRLQPDFAARVSAGGVAVLSEASKAAAIELPADAAHERFDSPWLETPAQQVDDESKSSMNRVFHTVPCLAGAEPYSSLYDDYLYKKRGGYFSVHGYGGTAIVAPEEGLLFIGGYE